MMGKSHVLSGAAVYPAAVAVLEWLHPALADISLGELVLGTAVCAGAAVLPDIDHSGSGVSRTFGPLTGAFSKFVVAASGGHRRGTHSFFGAAVFNLYAFMAAAIYAGGWRLFSVGLGIFLMLASLGWFLGQRAKTRRVRAGQRPQPAEFSRAQKALTPVWAATPAVLALSVLWWGSAAGTVALGLLMALTGAAAVRVMKIKGWVDDLIPLAAAYAAVRTGVDLSFVPYAFTLGFLTHIAGDSITLGGTPLAAPFDDTKMGLRKIRTGGWAERRPIALSLAAILAAGGGWNIYLLTTTGA